MLGFPEKERENFSRERRVKIREKTHRLIEALSIGRIIPSPMDAGSPGDPKDT